jgi:outer membrane lipoprotein-sorting protein
MPFLLFVMSLITAFAYGEDGDTPSEEPSVDEILIKIDDLFRKEHSIVTMEMMVKTSRYERTMKMEATSLGTEKTLIRILEPAKDAGTCTLKVDKSIWNYLPRVDRTMKIPSGMMGGSWMGSHLSNDDLVRENRYSEDFETKVSGKPSTSSDGFYTIELVPKPNVPIVWGKIVTRSTAELIPVDVKFYDEKGELKRTDTFSEIKEMDGVTMPTRFTIIPADKPNEKTEMTYLEVDFTTEVSEDTFNLQALRE